MILRIETPYFTAAVILDRFDNVTEAAPIIRYMLNWTFVDVQNYCSRKGWSWLTISDPRDLQTLSSQSLPRSLVRTS